MALRPANTELEVVVFDRAGGLLGRHGFLPVHGGASGAEPAPIVRIVQRAVAETFGSERAADEHDGGPFDRLFSDLRLDVAQRAAQDALIRPTRPFHHRDGTIGAVQRSQFGDDPVQRMDRQMHRQRRAGGAERGQCFAGRHRRGAAGDAGQHHALRDFRHGQFAPQHGGGGSEGRHAGGQRVVDAVALQPADLLGHRAVDRQIAGMQPRHVQARGRGCQVFLLDLVERHRRGVDDPGARAGNAPAAPAARSSRRRGTPGSVPTDRARAA